LLDHIIDSGANNDGFDINEEVDFGRSLKEEEEE